MKQKITYRWVAVALAVFAGLLTIALTGVAFWLSYEHLHDVAGAHGLPAASPRSWAWPATLDTFIVIGEVLILRSSLTGKTDWWAVFLAAAGSGGSITLNVVGVGSNADALDYVVAAVPPVAALLAFGALMRQLHGMIKAYLTETDGAPVSRPSRWRKAQEPVSQPDSAPPVPASHPAVPVAQKPVQAPSQTVPVSLTKLNGTPSQKVSLSHPGRVPLKKRPRATRALVPPAPGTDVDLLTTSQAAGLAGVPASTIRTWKQRGKKGQRLVPAIDDPDVLYSRESVIKFLEATK
jgi:uncharacterized protein DUF2637